MEQPEEQPELLKLLAALPITPTVTRADLHPGDVIVITFPGHIGKDAAERLKTYAEQNAFTGYKVVVLDSGASVSVIRPEQ